MDSHTRTNCAFERASELGLINPVTGEGAPTREMIAEAIMDAESDRVSGLFESADKLARWVESPRHSHEEVRDHNGRLKDTGIWAKFYVSVNKEREEQSL